MSATTYAGFHGTRLCVESPRVESPRVERTVACVRVRKQNGGIFLLAPMPATDNSTGVSATGRRRC